MKLTNEFISNDDFQKKIAELRIHIEQNVKVQDGEISVAAGEEMLRVYDGMMTELETLIARSNKKNGIFSTCGWSLNNAIMGHCVRIVQDENFFGKNDDSNFNPTRKVVAKMVLETFGNTDDELSKWIFRYSYGLVMMPFQGFSTDDLRTWLINNNHERNLATALAYVWNKSSRMTFRLSDLYDYEDEPKYQPTVRSVLYDEWPFSEDESDNPKVTPEILSVLEKIRDEWSSLEYELRDKAIAILKEENESGKANHDIQNKGGYFQLMPFMHRNGIKGDTNGGWERCEDGSFSEADIGTDGLIKFKYTGTIHIGEEDHVRVTDAGGAKHSIITDTDINGVITLAGEGANEPLRIADKLVKVFGGNAKDWFYARGRCLIEVACEREKADLHWHECSEIGAIERYIRGWYIDGKYIKGQHPKKKETTDAKTNVVTLGDNNSNKDYGILTDAGIIVNGETITDGKVIKLARMAKALLENGDEEGFMLLMESPMYDELADNEQRLILCTVITEEDFTILDKMCVIEYLKTPDPDDLDFVNAENANEEDNLDTDMRD